jgi:hypothetical protein
MHQLRNDIPIPGDERPRRDTNGPWRTMAVGESFFMRKAKSAEAGCYYRNSQEDGRRFTWQERTEEVDGVPVRGARVWRTA